MRLQNKRVLITGSSSGVGLAVAHRFVTEGAQVILHSHLPRDRCPDIAGYFPVTTPFIQQDLTQLADLPDFIERAWALLDGIDVLVCNAGTYREPTFLELTLETLTHVHSLNLLAPMVLIQHWATRCRAAAIRGKAICTTSVNGILSEPDHVAYDSSKAGLNGAVRAMAIDLRRYHITVNAVSLGLVLTPLTEDAINAPGMRSALDELILMGLTRPDEVTGIYVHLASDDSGAATGGIFPVDGGLSATQATLGTLLVANEQSAGAI